MGMFKRGRGAGNGGPHLMASTSLPTVVVLILVIYCVGDLGLHVFRFMGQRGLDEERISSVRWYGSKLWEGHRDVVQHEPGCETVEDFIEDGDYFNASAAAVGNAWRQLKWVLPPAKCRVKGQLIERLDPVYNYRRGVALGFTTDPDDKQHVEHWFLGTRVDLNKRKRRVFIDLGANYFGTSVVWFSVRYPCDFTEVHAFEADSSLFSMPEGFDEETNFKPPGTPGFGKVRGREGQLPKWMMNRIHYYNKYAGTEDNENSVNITRFIKDELKLTADDAVVVKMDIEGSEWPILQQWLNDPDLPSIIDELWAEVHYYHPPDNDWLIVKEYTRDQTTRLLAELRFRGWYVHYWD